MKEPQHIGRKIISFKEIDSTNLEAKRLAAAGAETGTVITAERQINGRGRLGRSWASPLNDGLYFSIIVKEEISPDAAAQMTVTAGYCVCVALRALTGLDVKIKWPNDIIYGSKKLCGILTEMSSQGEKLDYAVIGIGINVSNKAFDEDISRKATSLYLESGTEFSKTDVLNAVLKEIDKHYADICNGLSDDVIKPYADLCATVGRNVKVMRSGAELEGIATAVNKSGELVINADGSILTVSSGEVTVQGIY